MVMESSGVALLFCCVKVRQHQQQMGRCKRVLPWLSCASLRNPSTRCWICSVSCERDVSDVEPCGVLQGGVDASKLDVGEDKRGLANACCQKNSAEAAMGVDKQTMGVEKELSWKDGFQTTLPA